MIKRGIWVVLGVVLLTVAGACSKSSSNTGATSSPASSASGTPSASPAMAAHGVENLTVTASVRASLTSAYVSLRQISASDVSGTEPGSVYYAIDHDTKTYWALATFIPSKSASQNALVGFQDGGDVGMYKMHVHGAWSVSVANSSPPLCAELAFFPAAVQTAWHFSTSTPPACAPASPSAAPQAVPVLGTPWSPNQKGYGEVRPATVDNNGDPTGRITGISWASWGGVQATGHGTSTYVAPGQSVAQGQQQTATIVAFNLGTCGGKYMYQSVEWYFPQHGGTFSSSNYTDICNGKFVGSQ